MGQKRNHIMDYKCFRNNNENIAYQNTWNELKKYTEGNL